MKAELFNRIRTHQKNPAERADPSSNCGLQDPTRNTGSMTSNVQAAAETTLGNNQRSQASVAQVDQVSHKDEKINHLVTLSDSHCDVTSLTTPKLQMDVQESYLLSLQDSPILRPKDMGADSVASSLDLGERDVKRIQELERQLAAKNLELQTQKYIQQFKDFFATAYEEHKTTSDNVFWSKIRSKLCLDQFYKMEQDIDVDFDESKFLNLFKKAAEWLRFDGVDQYTTLQETYNALNAKLRDVDIDVDENSIIGDLEREIFAPEGQFDKYNGLVKSSIYASEIALFLTKQILDQEAQRVAFIKMQTKFREGKILSGLSSAEAPSQSQKVIQPLAIDAEAKNLLNELSHIYSAVPMCFLAEYFVQTMSEVDVDDKASMANFYKELTFLFKSLTAQELSEALILSPFDEGRLQRLAEEKPSDYIVNRQNIEKKPFFVDQPFAEQVIFQSQGQIMLNTFFEQMQRLMKEFDEAKQDVFYNSHIRNSDEQSLTSDQVSCRDMVSKEKYRQWLR